MCPCTPCVCTNKWTCYLNVSFIICFFPQGSFSGHRGTFLAVAAQLVFNFEEEKKELKDKLFMTTYHRTIAQLLSRCHIYFNKVLFLETGIHLAAMAGMYLILCCDSDCNTALYCCTLWPLTLTCENQSACGASELLTIPLSFNWCETRCCGFFFYAHHKKKKLEKNIMCKVKKRPTC